MGGNLVERMQSYGPLYVLAHLMRLYEDYKQQVTYLENLVRPLKARDVPSCVECSFINALCSRCSDALGDVQGGKALTDHALSLLTPITRCLVELPCECGTVCDADDHICERCLNLVLEIRGLEPARRAGARKLEKDLISSGMDIVDIVIRKDECFPAGYRARKIEELKKLSPSDGALRRLLA